MDFLQGLWAQYGGWVIVALVIPTASLLLAFFFKAMRDWALARKMMWLVPLIDGLYTIAEAAVTGGAAKRARVLEDFRGTVGRDPRANEMPFIDMRLNALSSVDHLPEGSAVPASVGRSPSLQLNPNGGQTMGGSKVWPQL